MELVKIMYLMKAHWMELIKIHLGGLTQINVIHINQPLLKVATIYFLKNLKIK